jgi:putative FmdB family regulatory protein
MPLYEYECRRCDRRSEALQRISDPPLATCGECGGELRRLLSAPAFQFKGSGWYVTDYARAKPAPADGKSGEPAAGKGEGAAAPADAGPAKTEKAATAAKGATAGSD